MLHLNTLQYYIIYYISIGYLFLKYTYAIINCNVYIVYNYLQISYLKNKSFMKHWIISQTH